MAITLFMVVGVAAATGAAGLSSALGAFLAGLLLSETEYRHHVEIDLVPFKGLLLGLFFITVGMTVDLRMVWMEIDVVLVAVAGLLAVKSVILFVACRTFRVSAAVAAEVAILLAQGGEFAFIVIALGRMSGLLAGDTAQLATAVVGLSMMVTPLCAVAARWLGRRVQHVEHARHTPGDDLEELQDHVVIGGYGRVGQTIAPLARRRECALRRARYRCRVGERVPQARAPVLFRRCRPPRALGARRRRPGARVRGDGQRAGRQPSAWWRRRTSSARMRSSLPVRSTPSTPCGSSSSVPSMSSRKQSRQACSSAGGCSKVSAFPTRP